MPDDAEAPDPTTTTIVEPAPTAPPARGEADARARRVTPTLAELDLPARFEVRRIIGSGGMGVVVEVLDRTLGREVAVKVLATDRKGEPTHRVRFLREARAAAVLRHPNIVTVHDVDPERDLIVMELIHGESLRDRLRREPRLAPAEVRRIGLALLDAFATVHDAGIVHRDVKPANILIEVGGAVKLVDFGIASFGDRDLTSSGTTIGTPSYMAPEQLRGRVADARADLYAVGATLFEAATGSKLHATDGTWRDVAAAVREATGDVAMASAIERAVAEFPEERFADARAFAAALAVPPAAEPSPSPTPTPRRRRRRGAVIAAAALAVIVAALVLATRGARAPAVTRSNAAAPTLAAPTLAVLPFADHTGLARLDFAASGLAHILGTALQATPGLHVVGYYQLLDRLPDPAAPAAAWLAAARELGADVVVRGELAMTPTAVRVTVEVTSSAGATLGRVERTCPVEAVPATTRALAADVARTILGRPAPALVGVPRRLEIERDLQLGIAALERQHFAVADDHLQRVELEAPDLAEVYYHRAVLNWWLSRDVHTPATRALAGSLDAAQRGFLENLLILTAETDPPRAIAGFQDLAARFPTHRDIAYGLFEALFHGGRAAEAMVVFRQLGARHPRFRLGLKHALTYYVGHADADGVAWALARLEPGDEDTVLWQARALVARRDYPAAIALLRRQGTAASDHELAPIYLLADQPGLATDLAAGWASEDVAHRAAELLGLAKAHGDAAAVTAWSRKAAFAAELATGADQRERGWLELAAVELPDAPAARLRPILDALRAEPRVNAVVARLLLAGTLGDRAPVEAARGSGFPEVAAAAAAFVAEWAQDWPAAARAWERAAAAAADGNFVIVERLWAARAWRAAGDRPALRAACDEVIRPRRFTWAWGGAVGPCRRWSAAAAAPPG